MVYGWFLKNGRRVYGLTLSYSLGNVLIEDVADYKVRHTIPVQQFHVISPVQAT